MKSKKTEKLLTFENEKDVFNGFTSDKERIRYNSNNYKNMGIAKAFALYYGVNVSNETKMDKSINQVIDIQVGDILVGTVKEFNERYMTFELPGVKDEIISKEGLWPYAAAINAFLVTHDNKLMFEVREKKEGKYYVSVLNAYYLRWVESIERACNGDEGIDVHIDELVPGGYKCHCNIAPLTQLTGQSFTSLVFIPGSHIVLNIEHDFNRWIGQDVTIIPQKFAEYVDYTVGRRNGIVEKSLVGSRKRVLQIMGNHYLHEMWNIHKLGEANLGNFDKPSYEGTVTGIINSNKKTGVFVELDGKYITGLLPLEASDLLNYKPGDSVIVKVAEFEVQPDKEPFVIGKNNKVIKCHTRPVFELG